VTDRDGNDEIYVMDLDGSNPTRVTSHAAADWASSWVDDGSRLIIETERDGNWEIYSIRVDGSDPVRLTTHSASDRFPEWRP
jgi:TolB protein